MFVVSEEPDYPCGLMTPRRRRPEGGFGRREPLGVEFAVGRWVRHDSQPGELHVALAEAHVLAPDYGDERRNLPNAEAEAQFVCERFNGTRIDPASMDRFDAVLGAQPRPLIHFIGRRPGGADGIEKRTWHRRPPATATSARSPNASRPRW